MKRSLEPNGHTAQCNKNRCIDEVRTALWEARFPNYCRNCGGQGGISYPPGYDDPGDYEPCPECTEKGLCPRCGKPTKELSERKYYEQWYVNFYYTHGMYFKIPTYGVTNYDEHINTICEYCGWSETGGDTDPDWGHPTFWGGWECNCWEPDHTELLRSFEEQYSELRIFREKINEQAEKQGPDHTSL